VPGDGDTKERLLTEARDLYLEGGFAHFSLREVARRTGISAAAVYRHFDSREALLREVCAAGFQIFYAYLVRSLSEPTARARLSACAKQYARFGLEHPRYYRVIFMGDGQETSVARPLERTSKDPTFLVLVDRVRECMADGVIRRGDVEETAVVIWAHVHGLVSLRLSGHLAQIGAQAQFEAFYASSTERLLVGLAT